MALTYSSTDWPDIVGQSYSKTPRFKVLTSPATFAGDQRQEVAGVVYRFSLGWTALNETDASYISEAVNMLAGQWGEMWFWEWKAETHAYSFTTTDTDFYVLPARDVSDATFLVNGVITPVEIANGIGEHGEDGIGTFGEATVDGADGLVTFTGRYLRRVRLVQDNFRQTDRSNDSNLWQGSVVLMEVGS